MPVLIGWRKKVPCVYILASGQYGTLYIGVTSEACARISAHRQKLIPGFTKRYGVTMLVYYEFHGTMEDAIIREKQLPQVVVVGHALGGHIALRVGCEHVGGLGKPCGDRAIGEGAARLSVA